MNRLFQAFAVLAIACFAMGCAGRPWNTAQTVVVEIGEAVEVVDELINERDDAAAETERAEVVAAAHRMRDAGEEITPEVIDRLMVDYRAGMAQWQSASDALEIVSDTLRAAESAIGIWRSTGESPSEWGDFCRAIGPALESLIEVLGHIPGFDVPAAVRSAVGLAPPVCAGIVGLVQPSGDEE